ncbi:MBL fold metallo-hydrolase, partial [Bacillus sp. SIMBA_161]
VKIHTGGKTVLIDPFITGNELTDLTASGEKPDAILLTQTHNDHVGDTLEIAKSCGAIVVAPVELANYLNGQGVEAVGMN